MKSFAQIDIESNGNYLKLLNAVAKLSGLFSESAIPFINYRVAENIFCRCFNAQNLSRSDTAFDASYNGIGIGLKTFACTRNYSVEKIAEFNQLSRQLKDLSGKSLAVQLAQYRNDRIDMAKSLYNIQSSLYHIVARKQNEIYLFETDYSPIDIPKIRSVKETVGGLQFEDGQNNYSFNYSKSTLFRRFHLPQNAFRLPIEIIADPYQLLLELFEDQSLASATNKLTKGEDYVILPLYGIKKGQKYVFEKSGLNQWNASGRKRDYGEIYIPIPTEIHKLYPSFFPKKDQEFELSVPTGEVFRAKVCQDHSKALMTNPNKALSDWLLRNILRLEEGELATIEKLIALGFDSVIITKTDDHRYHIDKAKMDGYCDFIGIT